MARKLNILITGGNGYIANTLYREMAEEHNVMSVTRNDFDMSDSKSVDNFFKHKLFDVVIHCAVKGGSRLKKETWNDMDENLKMYYNLLNNKAHYDKLIHFGSGAELYARDTPYGLSKKVISNSILEHNNFYNLRIYAVFDENELDTRYIKANIKRYINREAIEIYEDKYMDFIYMPDLVKIVNYYINNNASIKDIDCVYNTKYTLNDIAKTINGLDEYEVEIKIKKQSKYNYNGKFSDLPINFIGLQNGISKVYNKLKNNK